MILTIAAFLAVTPAWAWHAVGHKATASIAYDQLTPDRQREVISVLMAHPRFAKDFTALMPDEIAKRDDTEKGRWLLEQASVWPDLIQTLGEDVRREYNRSRWHYINMLVWLAETDEAALAGQLDHNMETEFSPPLRQNLNAIQALRGNLQTWHSDSAPDAERAVALCWILHLAGDLHQPLHTVALFSKAYFPKGDRGGNSVEVVWGDETRNLHAVWDGLPTTMDSLEPSPRTVRSIEEDVVDDAAIDEWLSHHANLARKFVYTDDVKAQLLAGLANEKPPTIELSHEYLVAAGSLAKRQVNLAGHRIAALIE
jgi:hypothetical protein